VSYPFDAHQFSVKLRLWDNQFNFHMLENVGSIVKDNHTDAELWTRPWAARTLMPIRVPEQDRGGVSEYRFFGGKAAFNQDWKTKALTVIGHTLSMKTANRKKEMIYEFMLVRKVQARELINLFNAVVLACCGCIKYQVSVFDVAGRAGVDLTLLLTFVVAGDIGVKGIQDYMDRAYLFCNFLLILSTLETPLMYVYALSRAQETFGGRMTSGELADLCSESFACSQHVNQVDIRVLVALAVLLATMVLSIACDFFAFLRTYPTRALRLKPDSSSSTSTLTAGADVLRPKYTSRTSIQLKEKQKQRSMSRLLHGIHADAGAGEAGGGTTKVTMKFV